jgi:hypothetical protein
MGGLFAVLLVLYLATSLNPPERTTGAEPFFKTPPNITRLEISKPDGSRIIIQELNGLWDIIQPIQYPASLGMVQAMILSLRDAVVDDILTDDPKRFSEFGLEDNMGTVLNVYNEDELVLDVVIGKHATHMGHTYVRESGFNEVMLWRGLYSQISMRTPDDWRDTTIFTYNPEDVVSISTVKAGSSRTLVNEGTAWDYTEDGETINAVPAKAFAMAQWFSSLMCDGFPNDADLARVAQAPPVATTSFRVRNGDVNEIEIWAPGETDGGRYLARDVNTGEIYRFYQYNGERLMLERIYFE